MDSIFVDIGKLWLVWRGRNKAAPRYMFQEKEIVSAPYPRKVSSLWKATYLNLHPTHYAVAITPDGNKIALRGGYNRLPAGHHVIHYVDKQNRVAHVPQTGEITNDGFHVALEVEITYKVTDPLKALEMQQAVETLLDCIQSDIKDFISSHKYDDLMGDMNGHRPENEQIARFIKAQHASRHQMTRLFTIEEVVIKDKIGDPKVTEFRETYHINQRQFAAQRELQEQNQQLEKKLTEQAAAIKRMKVEEDAKIQDMIQKMETQKIELENARVELQMRQEKWMRAMEAIGQALSSPAASRDPQVLEIIKQLLGTMGTSSVPAPTPTPAAGAAPGPVEHPVHEPTQIPNTDEMDALTNSLLGLLTRKKY